MNKVKLFIIAMLVNFTCIAQDSIRINYQGIALNASSAPIANTNISIRTRMYRTCSGSFLNIYEETRLVNTDANGYFDFQIGSGGYTTVYGNLKGLVPKPGCELKMETFIDPNGGSTYTSMGVQILGSVPSAIHSKVSDSLALPFNGKDNSLASFVITNDNSGASTAIQGSALGNHIDAIGISALVPLGNSAGTAVRGRAYSNGPIAVEGINTGGGVAIRAKATGATGIAVVAENTSTTGKALDVNGNVKIAGGNTSPGAGKVLTSDASGNATWKDPTKVAFYANYPGTTQNLPSGVKVTASFTEQYDAGNNFNPSTAATDPNTFVAPLSGLYHFDAAAYLSIISTVYNLKLCSISLEVNGITKESIAGNQAYNSSSSSKMQLQISTNMHLNIGDKVTITVYQLQSSTGVSASLSDRTFSGQLVVAD